MNWVLEMTDARMAQVQADDLTNARTARCGSCAPPRLSPRAVRRFVRAKTRDDTADVGERVRLLTKGQGVSHTFCLYRRKRLSIAASVPRKSRLGTYRSLTTTQSPRRQGRQTQLSFASLRPDAASIVVTSVSAWCRPIQLISPQFTSPGLRRRTQRLWIGSQPKPSAQTRCAMSLNRPGNAGGS